MSISRKPYDSSRLWCLPYDTESLYVPFLKISFSKFLTQLLSSQYFEEYKKVIEKELNDPLQWNKKCQTILKFFEFVSTAFQISDWDKHINFIEQRVLRQILARHRLWIDLQILYLLNFLKLDSSNFQDDRIFMSLYRTLIFFNSLFTRYFLKDFDQQFLNDFIDRAKVLLDEVAFENSKEIVCLVDLIKKMFDKYRKKNDGVDHKSEVKSEHLVLPKQLEAVKNSAKIKLKKLQDTVGGLQQRLKQTLSFQLVRRQISQIQQIINCPDIDQLTKVIVYDYDTVQTVKSNYLSELPPNISQNDVKNQLDVIVQQYKQNYHVTVPQFNVYHKLKENQHNPYLFLNHQIYGSSTKVDMSKVKQLEKTEEGEVISKEMTDQRSIYYEPEFQKMIHEVHMGMGRVTKNDINLKGNKFIGMDKRKNDQTAKVYNLKWHNKQRSTDRRRGEVGIKDYDNNLLFKSLLDDHVAQMQKKKMQKLMQDYNCKTYTIAVFKSISDEVYPSEETGSYGSNRFVKREPQMLDLDNLTTIEQSKFDFLRKVVIYMAAKSKIKNLISEKDVEDTYPRTFSDIKQRSYNTRLENDKIRFANGMHSIRPRIYI